MSVAAGVSIFAWVVDLPLTMCPMSLSKNGRVHWSTRNQDFQAQKDFVIRVWQCEQSPELREHLIPWERAWLIVNWRYARGRRPDDDNIISRVSAARDAFQYIGLVKDDAVIETAGVSFTRVDVGRECAVVTVVSDESWAREFVRRSGQSGL